MVLQENIHEVVSEGIVSFQFCKIDGNMEVYLFYVTAEANYLIGYLCLFLLLPVSTETL